MILLILIGLVLLAQSVLAETLTISWNPPVVDATHGAPTGYKVYKSTGAICDQTGALASLAATVGNVTTWTDPNVTAGVKTCYETSATNPGGESTHSNRVAQTIATPNPNPPKFEIGQHVQTNADTWAHPEWPISWSGTPLIYPTGTQGIITAGPQVDQGYTWWRVDFDGALIEGNVTEQNLVAAPPIEPPPSDTTIVIIECPQADCPDGLTTETSTNNGKHTATVKKKPRAKAR